VRCAALKTIFTTLTPTTTTTTTLKLEIDFSPFSIDLKDSLTLKPNPKS
jgi:hypothetical protein